MRWGIRTAIFNDSPNRIKMAQTRKNRMLSNTKMTKQQYNLVNLTLQDDNKQIISMNRNDEAGTTY